jgi:hypothetical protein
MLCDNVTIMLHRKHYLCRGSLFVISMHNFHAIRNRTVTVRAESAGIH